MLCRTCNKPLPPGNSKYCSKECTYNRRYNSGDRETIIVMGKPCGYCGKQFFPRSNEGIPAFMERKACSQKCGTGLSRKMARERHLTQPGSNGRIIHDASGSDCCHYWLVASHSEGGYFGGICKRCSAVARFPVFDDTGWETYPQQSVKDMVL